jgi:hypothetical protein
MKPAASTGRRRDDEVAELRRLVDPGLRGAGAGVTRCPVPVGRDPGVPARFAAEPRRRRPWRSSWSARQGYPRLGLRSLSRRSLALSLE